MDKGIKFRETTQTTSYAKVLEKMEVEDLREIMLMPIDSEFEINEEEGLQRSDSNFLRFSDVYDV